MADEFVPTRDYLLRPAVLSVKDGTGKVLCATDHFFLTQFNESDQERTATHYTSGDPSMYVGAGRNPRNFTYGGILTNTEQNGKQIAAWLFAYEHYLRGTKCVRLKATVELVFRDQYRKGYLTNCKIDHDTREPQRASFAFTMFVIDKGYTKRFTAKVPEERTGWVDVGLPEPTLD